MKLVRKLLSQALGFEGYLRLISGTYLWLTGKGLLNKQYPELFYLEKLVKPGDFCLDIGANLGYYSTFLSKIAGPNGHVYAVEPVPVFQEIWKKNVKRFGLNNLTLLPYALGAENTKIGMGTPTRNGLVHHGMTKVMQPGTEEYVHQYMVEMKVPDELFANLPRLDFVKCDVEGYEQQVFANMLHTLRQHKPVIQTELNGAENRRNVHQMLANLGYRPHVLENDNLKPVTETQLTTVAQSDFYFLP